MSDTLLTGLIGALIVAIPTIISMLTLYNKTSQNAKQVIIDRQASDVQKDNIVTNLALQAQSLAAGIETLKAKVRELEGKTIEQAASLAAQIVERAAKESAYVVQITALTKAVTDASTEIKKNNQLITLQNDQLTAANAEISRLTDEAKAHSVLLTTANTEIARLNEQITKLNKQIDILVKANAALTQDAVPSTLDATKVEPTVHVAEVGPFNDPLITPSAPIGVAT